MSDSDSNTSHAMHESAAPRLPLGEGASAASAALPIAMPRPRHPLHPLAGVVGVFVCGLVAFLTLYATQPLLPLLEDLFHASKAAVGWTVSASTLGVAISAPLLGMFTERMNRKRVILVNVLFSLVGVFTYITFYLAAPPFSLSTAKLSLLFVVYLVGLVATPLAGALLPRVGLRTGITGSILLSLAGVLLTLVPSLVVVVAGLALCCTGVFISQSCATSFLREAAPEASRASAVGLYVACYYIGGTVAGVAPSLVWRLGGWTACAAMVAIIDVISIVIARRGWSEPVAA
jgi:predicted MFS family arabinose efflux permease